MSTGRDFTLEKSSQLRGIGVFIERMTGADLRPEGKRPIESTEVVWIGIKCTHPLEEM